MSECIQVSNKPNQMKSSDHPPSFVLPFLPLPPSLPFLILLPCHKRQQQRHHIQKPLRRLNFQAFRREYLRHRHVRTKDEIEPHQDAPLDQVVQALRGRGREGGTEGREGKGNQKGGDGVGRRDGKKGRT